MGVGGGRAVGAAARGVVLDAVPLRDRHTGRLMTAHPQGGPLTGLRVLDLATLFAGPLAATMLGDFGAEVIKVEHPAKPDPSRGHGPSKEGVGLWWKLLGRNKQTITLDL